jgi:Xaa-Pro aminopeptidase
MSILFPHHIGHYIGLDVHDSPGFPRTECLEKGMCVTIEPYVHPSSFPSTFQHPHIFLIMTITNEHVKGSLCTVPRPILTLA